MTQKIIVRWGDKLQCNAYIPQHPFVDYIIPLLGLCVEKKSGEVVIGSHVSPYLYRILQTLRGMLLRKTKYGTIHGGFM